jgi:FkbM family methyltransferase
MLTYLRYKTKNLIYRLATRKVPRTQWDFEVESAVGYHSQCGQDKFIAERLKFQRDGVFVDIGANDGVTLSNSYYFEKELCWTGIAVEPLGTAFAKLSQSRECQVVHGCISDVDGEVEFLECDTYNGMLSGIVSKFHSKQLRTIERARQMHGGDKRMNRTLSMTPGRLLEKHGIGQIDYLSIDTEGGELDILRSFDFDDVFVRLISVENNHHDLTFRNHMQSCGFDLIAIVGHDEIYENREKRAGSGEIAPASQQAA